ncbi:glycosyltransferase [Pedobacter endophyticus]|uniref:Glycosyltransferase n=1 Tax=Pedobacter endophyticus TaxID=2789740 RepID=A0A7S9PZH0_9SPHI|nr:glycosyltransferase [Pedobacter endophyticus]QPH39935.1 glycosyltransferase [Pedobacter endophyticus]
MKVLHITFSDTGGAGAAALRLHKGLLSVGVASKLLVMEKRTDNEEVYAYPKKNKYLILFLRVLKKMRLPQTLEHKNDNLYKGFKGNFEYFSFAKTSFVELPTHPLVQQADVINLHWIPNFVDYTSFFDQVKKPIVWTQHDMNAFQGGFHYKDDNFRNDHLHQYNNEQYQQKLLGLSRIKESQLVVVSPSKWMYNEAKSSEILGRFKHVHIPNGLDPQLFYFKDKQTSGPDFRLDGNKIKVLFISETVKSIRKGFTHILDLLNDAEIAQKCQFIAVGSIKESDKVKGVKYLGKVNSEAAISDIYNMADIYLLPSLEDNFPNVMLESLACGTPVVGFDIGGLKDLITNDVNGYLSESITVSGLKAALLKCIDHIGSFDKKAIANQIGTRYNTKIQAESYLNIYKTLNPSTGE